MIHAMKMFRTMSKAVAESPFINGGVSWAVIVKVVGVIIPLLATGAWAYLKQTYPTREDVAAAVAPMDHIADRVANVEMSTKELKRISDNRTDTLTAIKVDISSIRANVESVNKTSDRIFRELDALSVKMDEQKRPVIYRGTPSP